MTSQQTSSSTHIARIPPSHNTQSIRSCPSFHLPDPLMIQRGTVDIAGKVLDERLALHLPRIQSQLLGQFSTVDDQLGIGEGRGTNAHIMAVVYGSSRMGSPHSRSQRQALLQIGGCFGGQLCEVGMMKGLKEGGEGRMLPRGLIRG